MSALCELRKIVTETEHDDSFCAHLLDEIDDMIRRQEYFYQETARLAADYESIVKRHGDFLHRIMNESGTGKGK